MQEHYYNQSMKEIAMTLRRTETSVIEKRKHLKMKPKRKTRAWTQQEIELVRLNFEKVSHADLAEVLGRTENAVRNLCYEKGFRKKANNWTDDELALLKKYYSQTTIDLNELERIFRRHKTNISRKARELGLTDQGRSPSPKTLEKIRQSLRKWHSENEHPRGFEGRVHNAKTRAIIGEKSKELWADPNSRLNSNKLTQFRSDRMMEHQRTNRQMRQAYSRGKMGKREDLNGLFVRSSWEANYARYLNWLKSIGEIDDWEYEADCFVFEAIKRGTRSYTPDFKIYNTDDTIIYHEVKGWMDSKSKTKLKRMAKYYPEVEIVLIDEDAYRAIEKDVRMFIPNWE